MNTVDAIFDAFGRLSELTGLADAARRKDEQIRDIRAKVCGNCDHWMKSTCVPEKVHKQFKSMGSIGCGAFVRDWQSLKLDAQFTDELKAINERIAAVRLPSGTGQKPTC